MCLNYVKKWTREVRQFHSSPPGLKFSSDATGRRRRKGKERRKRRMLEHTCMHTRRYTYIQKSYMRTYRHIYIAYIHTYMCKYVHTQECLDKGLHTYIHADIQTYENTQIQRYARTQTRIFTLEPNSCMQETYISVVVTLVKNVVVIIVMQSSLDEHLHYDACLHIFISSYA